MKTNVKLSLILMLINLFSFAQVVWELGGNANGGANGLLTNSNYFGSTQNTSVLLGTNSFTRMIIDNGFGGVNAGRIAIGNNLPAGFAPQSRLHIHQNTGNPIIPNNTYIRFTNTQTGSGSNNGFAIGNSSAAGGPFGDVNTI